MNPTEENRPEFRKLLELPLHEKFSEERPNQDPHNQDPYIQDKEESE